MFASFGVQTDFQRQAPSPSGGSLLRLLAYGFVYWVLIVAALEPGNLANIAARGDSPRWGEELLRIFGAGLIGSVSVPVFVLLSRRAPIARPRPARNAGIHLVSAVTVGAVLIVLAHTVAALVFEHGRGLSWASFRADLAANELLLVLGLIGLSGLAHLFPSRSVVSPAQGGADAATGGREGPAALNDTVEVKVRGVTRVVTVEQIDWIEAQGNYLALHVGPSTFLVRDTLASFQTRLDPARFVRIHRGTIVAVDRIAAIEPAANGDGIVRLRDNQALRASRQYRRGLSVRAPA